MSNFHSFWVAKVASVGFRPPGRSSIKKNKKGWVRLRESGRNSQGVSREFFRSEFTHLLRHPQVILVEAWNDGFIVIFKAVSTLGSEKFFLGVYALRILVNDVRNGDLGNGFRLECLVSGRHNGAKTFIYSITGGLGGFCFGGRRPHIENLINAEEWFALTTSIIDAVSHVNKNDNERIRAVFRRILPDGTLEARKDTPTLLSRASPLLRLFVR